MKGRLGAAPERQRSKAAALSRRSALAVFGAVVLTPTSLSRNTQDARLTDLSLLPLPPSDQTVDYIHGVRIADPFRPLEDASRADVQAWVAFEDRRARDLLEADPAHAAVTRFIEESGRYARTSNIRRVGGRTFAMAFDGQKQQSWLEVRSSANEPGTPVLDPNVMAPDGSISLSGYFPDRSGTKVAYLTCENGGDAQLLRIRDTRTGIDLPDLIDGCRFTTVAWLPDGRSFLYSRPARADDPPEWDRSSQMVFHHRLLSAPSADTMVWRLPELRNALLTLSSARTSDRLHVTARIGTDTRNGFWVGPIGDPARLKMIVPMGLGTFRVIHTVDGTHYAITTHEAPRGRVVKVSQTNARPDAWIPIVPQGRGVIDAATAVGHRLVVRRIENLGHQIEIVDLDGGSRTPVVMDDGVRIGFEIGETTDMEATLDIEDRLRPRRRDTLNVLTGQRQTVQMATTSSVGELVVRRVEALSRDGTRIPITLMHRADMIADGATRSLLVGYGSYGIPQLPAYSHMAMAWARMGGLFAVANIRGGGEYGSDWHNDGRRAKKQNTMDDFAAAAQWLVSNGLTRRDRLGIYGASSGGRLVLSSIVQRPDLFGAAVAAVPVADMLRFPKFTFGVAWIQEYGDPDTPEDFATLRAHSPLHNVKAGTPYPPLLLMTGDNDQRVVPAHAWKMAATLRHANPGSRVWLRTRKGAGHGAGNAYAKWIDYQADVVSFLMGQLGGPRIDLPSVEFGNANTAQARTPLSAGPTLGIP